MIIDVLIIPGDDLREPENNERQIVASRLEIDYEYKQYGGLNDGNDIGLIMLREDLDIEPMPYAIDSLRKDAFGDSVRAVGFGPDNRLLGTGGKIKRAANLKVSDIREHALRVGGVRTNVWHGDSGGPIIRKIDGVDTIVEVTSGGRNGGLGYGPASVSRVDGNGFLRNHYELKQWQLKRSQLASRGTGKKTPPSAGMRPCPRGVGY